MKNYLIGLFLILTVILISFILFGENTIFSYFKKKDNLKTYNEELKLLKSKTEKLKSDVIKLNNKNLDLNLVDEIARDKHNMSDPDEVIIFDNIDKNDKKDNKNDNN